MLITEKTRVTLYFAIKLQDGTVVDSNFEQKPARFDMGDGSLLPGFEEKLLGLTAGDEATFAMPAVEAFGNHKEENVHTFSRTQLASYDLQPGLVISFADASKAEIPGVVKELDDDSVIVDFNHPLAGRDLHFDVAIIKVEPIGQLANA
ncbi:MAG: FKBP-type peptidyl-prolyl cis-trans isomerase [Pseudomonadales bacterium]